MSIKIKTTLLLIFIITILFTFYNAFGSRSLSADKLYAIKLEQPPEERDWDNAVPLITLAKNGNRNELKSSVDIDKDTVHVTTKSCHHVPPSAPPVEVSIKAYYTDNELFIRAAWHDTTKDDKIFEFTYKDDKWNVSDKLEDGFGIMWDTQNNDQFNCSQACHAIKWHLKDYNLVAQYKMSTLDDSILDLWNWKAFRTNSLNFADDKHIDKKGILPDNPSKIYFYNSELKGNYPLDDDAYNIVPMDAGDIPINDYDEISIKESHWILTGTAPGVKVTMPTANRADIKAIGEYKNDKWVVTLRRKLITDTNKDVTFNIKRNNTYKFGVAVMDDTLTNHYAVEETLELVFVVPENS